MTVLILLVALSGKVQVLEITTGPGENLVRQFSEAVESEARQFNESAGRDAAVFTLEVGGMWDLDGRAIYYVRLTDESGDVITWQIPMRVEKPKAAACQLWYNAKLAMAAHAKCGGDMKRLCPAARKAVQPCKKAQLNGVQKGV